MCCGAEGGVAGGMVPYSSDEDEVSSISSSGANGSNVNAEGL